MIDIKGNFPESHRGNFYCELCNDETEEETQTHLLKCKFLLNHPEIEAEIKLVNEKDVFKDLVSQTKSVKLWKKILKIRKIKLKIK